MVHSLSLSLSTFSSILSLITSPHLFLSLHLHCFCSSPHCWMGRKGRWRWEKDAGKKKKRKKEMARTVSLILIKEIKSTVSLEKVEKNRYTYQTQNSIFSHLKIYHLKYGIKHIFSIMSTKYVFSQHFFTYSFHNILNNNT